MARHRQGMFTMTRTYLASGFAIVFAASMWASGRAQSGGPIVSGAHRFEKVADGIYYATASGTMNVGANSPIIVNDDEAIVIDSEITPAAGARAGRRSESDHGQTGPIRDRLALSLRPRCSAIRSFRRTCR